MAPWTKGLAAAAAALLLLGVSLALEPYQTHILVLVCVYAYVGVAWNILGGFAGQLSFGHALYLGIGAYTSTLLLLRLQVNPWLGMAAGAVLAALAGVGLAFVSFHYRLREFYFGLVTMASVEIARLLALNIKAVGAAEGLYVPVQQEGFRAFQFSGKTGYYYIALAMLVAILLLARRLRHSKAGHYMLAIRENEDAARALGINVMRYKLLAAAISAGLTAAGGTFMAQFTTFVDPYSFFHIDVSVQTVIYAVVGGIGTVIGPVAGALLLIPVAETIRGHLGNAFAWAHLFIFGLVLICVMMFSPGGLVGLWQTWRERRRAPITGTAAAGPSPAG